MISKESKLTLCLFPTNAMSMFQQWS